MDMILKHYNLEFTILLVLKMAKLPIVHTTQYILYTLAYVIYYKSIFVSNKKLIRNGIGDFTNIFKVYRKQ